MPFLIDGYNLLWSVNNLSQEAEPITEAGLCWKISRYMQILGESGEIIFDGTGPRDKSVFDEIPKLSVLFAGLGVEADDVIETKIKINTAPKRLSVVSNDRRLIKAARARKAVSLKNEELWIKLAKGSSRRKKTPEPPQKQHGLSNSETEQWLKFFDMDK
jgi:predicted RNA-binding protein with PIN domain